MRYLLLFLCLAGCVPSSYVPKTTPAEAQRNPETMDYYTYFPY